MTRSFTSRSFVLGAVLCGATMASCDAPQLGAPPPPVTMSVEPLVIGLASSVGFATSGFNATAARPFTLTCPDGSCLVRRPSASADRPQDGRGGFLIVPTRTRVRAVFEAETEGVYSRPGSVVAGSFEADAAEPRLSLAIATTEVLAPSVRWSQRPASAFLVGASFTLQASPRFDGLVIDTEGDAIELIDAQSSGSLSLDKVGLAARPGRAVIVATGTLGPIPIAGPSTVEVGGREDVVEQWLLGTVEAKGERPCTEPSKCASDAPLHVERRNGEFVARVGSLVRLKSGTYAFGGAGATVETTEYLEDADIGLRQRTFRWISAPPPSTRIVTRLGATTRSYALAVACSTDSDCVDVDPTSRCASTVLATRTCGP